MLFNRTAKKARKQYEAYYQLARKIHAYRCDLIPPRELAVLEDGIARMRKRLKDKQADWAADDSVVSELEPILLRYGRHFHPRHFFAENAEMLLFAAILAIGIRSFFFQPFKIPTNSMYPSYNGMTAAVYTEEADAPSAAGRLVRLLALGAAHQRVDAPASGELALVEGQQLIPARKWLVIPTQKLRYTFIVGGERVPVDVPLQFDFRLIMEPLLADANVRRSVLPDGTRVLLTGKRFEQGEFAFAFDVLTGDQLFVDRLSYHFVRPKVGDPIVFRTDNLPDIDRDNRDKYYIKRAVAGPGDVLVIDPPGLLLNGEPITGARAFEKNRNREAPFTGYVMAPPSSAYPLPIASGRQPIHIPEEHYFAMGDNSPNSADSRMWGFVPQREIVGRAFFIYYPFNDHWGIAR
jgi:signal peptidase I